MYLANDAIISQVFIISTNLESKRIKMGIFYLKASKSPLDEKNELENISNYESSIHINHSGCTHYFLPNNLYLAHFKIPTYFYEADETFYEEEKPDGSKAITLLQGYCYLREPEIGENSILDASKIHNLLLQENLDIESLRVTIAGEYAVIHIDFNSNVLIFNDLVGMEQIYYHNSLENYCVASNRLSFIEKDRNRSQFFDYEAMLCLPTTAFIDMDGTYLREVFKLRQDHVLCIENYSFNPQRLKPHFYHFGRMENDFSQEKFDDLLERGINESINWLQRVTHDKEKIELGITGGKDSRTVLALCLMAGLKDKIELFTNGTNEHPEVIVGKQIAQQFNLPHEIRQPGIPPTLDLQSFHRNIAVHVFQTEGLMTPWDIQNRGSYPTGLSINGTCGEFFRPFQKYNQYLTEAPSTQSITRYFDPLDIIDTNMKRQIESRISAAICTFIDYGAQYEDLPNIYHIANSYTGWLGTSLRLNSYAITTIKPLYSYFLTNLAFSLPAKVRATEIIHYSIIERCSRNLLELPFFAQKWDPQLEKYGKTYGLNVEPLPPPVNTSVHGSWQFQFNKNPELRLATAQLFEQRANAKIWKYINKEKLLKKLEKGKFSMPELHSLFGIIGVFFKSENIEIPRKMYNHQLSELENERISLVGNKKTGVTDINFYKIYHKNNNFQLKKLKDPFFTDEYAINLLSENFSLPSKIKKTDQIKKFISKIFNFLK